ncbi:uncharacterized protein PRCAT00005601001 [Priceomyces carsonii]|uniref:uncharacterized protein n=1 Tax=Priceomyces carsonii TaxID=28549 RepID=UPI002ED978CA|nr:unnamed protein product [Priceomyces carsonii]
MLDWLISFPGFRLVLTTAKKVFGRVIRTGPTPKHIGIIMDGNRRYAMNHKIELKEGHNLGFESMASILELLYESGIECATVFAFSIENFKRLKYEVKWLMDLAKLKFMQISQHGELCEEFGVKVKILGNISLLPKDVQDILKQTEEMSKNNTRAVLNVCFPYTSRDEIVTLMKRVVEESLTDPNIAIDENAINQHLFTSDVPPLELLVRTSGTYRLSDFLLWQSVSSNCSIVFVDKLWPEFTPWDMAKILIDWGFNTYWYGSGNGPMTRKDLTPRTQKSVSLLEKNGSTGFEHYESDHEYLEDDENYDEIDDSDAGTDEINTVTSDDVPDILKKSP